MQVVFLLWLTSERTQQQLAVVSAGELQVEPLRGSGCNRTTLTGFQIRFDKRVNERGPLHN